MRQSPDDLPPARSRARGLARRCIRLCRGTSPAVAGVIGLIAALLLAFWISELPRQQRDASRKVSHTLEVLGSAAMLEAHLATMSSEGRAFFVDRSAESRSRFEVAAAQMQEDLRQLAELTEDNPRQRALLARLEPLIIERAAVLRRVIVVVAAGGSANVAPDVLAHRGRALMDRAVGALEMLKAEERRLLVERSEAAGRLSIQAAAGVVVSGVIVSFSGVITVMLLLGRSGERRMLTELSRLNTDLERRVVSRTAELSASVARQRGYFQNSPVGMVILRVAGEGEFVVEDVNAAASAIYGLAREDAIGFALQEIVPPSFADDAERRLQACVAGRRNVRYTAARPLGGKARVLDVELAPLFDVKGDVRHVLACVRDMSEQRELERQAVIYAQRQAEAAERETALFRNSPDILFIARVEETGGAPAFVYEAVSPALERLAGVHPDEWIGRKPEECLSPAMANSMLTQYRRCWAQGTTLAYAATYDLPSGRHEFEGSVTPVRNPADGRIVRLAGALRDVTERNLMEATLRHGQKMEAIGRLSAGVAHDFNNILQSIVGGLELVLDEVPAGSGPHEFAAVALGSAKRGSYLTHHLLSYARKQMLRPQVVALPSFLADMKTLLARSLGPHIAIKLELAAASPIVLVDPGQLQTALLNLAINSADAMPEGGTLAIHVQEENAADQRFVAIAVTDTGMGMDATTLALAVEPFFTTKGLEGTGLGLSMVQGFAEQSGGRFRIHSDVGEGTTVELCLPAAVSDDRHLEPVGDAGGPAISGRVLVVDDDPDVLAIMAACMTRAGFEIIKASGGTEALALVAGGTRIDLLVSDYAMPGLNGIGLIAASRKIYPALPAVLITGYVELRDAASLPEGVLILHKPFQGEDLVNALRSLIPEDRAEACLTLLA